MNNKIRIKPLIEGLKPIVQAHEGEWIDLRSAIDIEMEAGEYKKIPLGVAIQLPDGYEAIVAARSSTFAKWGIIAANGIGVIDNLYCGENDEWSFPAIALRKTHIHKNDRICQFRIIYQQPSFDMETVKKLGNADRGGFGSTGKD